MHAFFKFLFKAKLIIIPPYISFTYKAKKSSVFFIIYLIITDKAFHNSKNRLNIAKVNKYLTKSISYLFCI
jgi:hypothetical protein